MKDRLKKWQTPKVSQLNISDTKGGSASHSESYVKPNGNAQAGRIFGGGAGS